jgi:cytochrome P450
MAANDTSSAALGSALYFLMENPDWEERVYQEAQLLLGNDQLTFEQLNGCGFNDIRRVKRETLRLLPPGYLRTREAAYDEYLGEYHIPRGSFIFVSPLYFYLIVWGVM